MKTFTILTIFITTFSAFSQQKPPFIPRPTISFFLNDQNADSRKTIARTDTLLEVKAIFQGQQKQKMPDVAFLISEVEIAVIRNQKKIGGLVIEEGKGSLAPLRLLSHAGDKYQLTVRGIKFLYNGIYNDIGTGNIIKEYIVE